MSSTAPVQPCGVGVGRVSQRATWPAGTASPALTVSDLTNRAGPGCCADWGERRRRHCTFLSRGSGHGPGVLVAPPGPTSFGVDTTNPEVTTTLIVLGSQALIVLEWKREERPPWSFSPHRKLSG